MRNLVLDGINVISAETSTKLDVDGISKPYEVFKIKLDLLYYNDRNDRIATWISQYVAEKGDLDVNDESYNNTIHDFICESNEQAMRKTMNNIRSVKQRVPGVVLRDGRIIDGNRRYTCLRTLAKENDEFNYFEAVILDHDYENNEKTIKALELKLQHGADKQVDYNPIDRLVGVYNDLIRDQMFTAKEYAQYTDSKLSEVNKNIELAKILVEFLEFINTPLQFHLARKMDLDGPIHEIYGALSKVTDEERKDSIKRSMFMNLTMRPDMDITRYIRKIKNFLTDEEIAEEFLSKQDEYADEFIEKISGLGQISEKVLRDEIQNDEDFRDKLYKSVNETYERYSHKEIKNEPVKQISNAKDLIENVDLTVLKMIDSSKISEVREALVAIEAKARELKDEL